MHHRDEAITKKVGPMLTITEVSEMLHVHPNTLRRWNNQGIVSSYRISTRGDRRFGREDIAYLLSQLKNNGYSIRKVKLAHR